MDLQINECTNSCWFCPACTEPALKAVFFDKDIDEDVKYFLAAWKQELPVLKANSFPIKILLKFLKTLLNKTIQQLCTAWKCWTMKVNAVEKVPNESSNTDSIHRNEVNNKENSNTNQKQDKLVLMNQLKDWQLRQNNVIVYNITQKQPLSIVPVPQPICCQSLNNS